MGDTWYVAWMKTFLIIVGAGFLMGAFENRTDALVPAAVLATWYVYDVQRYAAQMSWVPKALCGGLALLSLFASSLAVASFSFTLFPSLRAGYVRWGGGFERSGANWTVIAISSAFLAWASWRESMKYRATVPRSEKRVRAGKSPLARRAKRP